MFALLASNELLPQFTADQPRHNRIQQQMRPAVFDRMLHARQACLQPREMGKHGVAH